MINYIVVFSYNIPDKIDWVTALAEFLFVILAQVPLGGNSNVAGSNVNGNLSGIMSANSISSHNYKAGRSQSSNSSWQPNANNFRRSTHLISLAPYVANLLLSSIFGSNIPPSIDWIFWGLAKVSNFLSYLTFAVFYLLSLSLAIRHFH